MCGVINASFQPLGLYPELEQIASRYEVIRDEALAARAAMMNILDSRARPGTWRVLPLLAENEDRGVVPDSICRANRCLAPETTKMIRATLPRVEAYSFSALEANGHIRPHRHTNLFVTAALCLQDGGNSYIVVDGRRRQYRDGEVIVFDYTLQHEAFNLGPNARIVLLMLLDNRMRAL